jgi:Lysylphosphatidylglycerol synthase TM region
VRFWPGWSESRRSNARAPLCLRSSPSFASSCVRRPSGQSASAIRGLARRLLRSPRRSARERTRSRPYIVHISSGYVPRLCGRLIRVTQLPNRYADSTAVTAVMRLLSNRKVQLVLNGGFGLVLLAVAFFSARHFVGSGWPIHHADPVLLSGAALLFLAAAAFKAWGWQRLFHVSERPSADALAFAGGAACVGGIALPGRVDDAIRIAVVKRYPGTKTGIGTLGLSLIILGMLDNAALTPLASVAAAGSSHWTTRAGFAVVAAAGVAAAGIVAFLPRIARLSFVARWRFGRWLAQHTHCTKEAWVAWLLISVSWSLRGLAVFLLLNALSMPGSYVLALAFLVASAASAALPIAPAGAATQAGAGAAILALSGVGTAHAVAFSIAAQALVIVTGAAVMLLIASWQLSLRLRPRFTRATPAAEAA